MPRLPSVSAEIMTEGDNLQELGKTQKTNGSVANDAYIVWTLSIGKSTHFPSSRAEKKSTIYEDFYENRTYQEAESH